jgi:hypothetical protein
MNDIEISGSFEVPSNWTGCHINCNSNQAHELGDGFLTRYGVICNSTPSGLKISLRTDNSNELIRPDSKIEDDFRDLNNAGIEVTFT